MPTLKLTKKYEKYPEYKDSGVEWLGRIPKEWKILKGKFVFQNKKEINIGMKNNNVLSLTMNGVINRDSSNNEGLLPSDYQSFQIFEKDDLVFKLIDLENYKTSRVGIVHEKGIMSPVYIRLEAKKNYLPKYFYYLYYRLYIEGIYNFLGSGVRSSLSPRDLMEMGVVIPNIREQKSIALFLDDKIKELDLVIDKKQKLIELLQEKRTAVINHAVTKGLDPKAELVDSSIEWIGKIPVRWQMRKIFHLFRTIGSGTTPDDKYLTDSEDVIPWLNTGDLTDSYVEKPSRKLRPEALEEYSTLKLFSKNAVVIAMYGATIGKLGMPQFDFCTNQACCVLEGPNQFVSEKFIYFWLLGNKKYIIEMGVGGGQPNINKDIVKSLKISLPPKDIQDEIVIYLDKKISEYDKAIKYVERSIDSLQEFKSSLISNVVTGKVRV